MELFNRLLPEYIVEWRAAASDAKRTLITHNFMQALVDAHGRGWLAENAVELIRRIKEEADALSPPE